VAKVVEAGSGGGMLRDLSGDDYVLEGISEYDVYTRQAVGG
jgi:hypothetical protein